jgi:putative pyruvate formate lyase activating enzyme
LGTSHVVVRPFSAGTRPGENSRNREVLIPRVLRREHAMPSTYPAYLERFESGELADRAARAVDSLADCALCARQCHADRLDASSRKPYCRTGRRAVVSSCFAHHGEESCLRGWNGSGTIFFTHCNLRCVFCQNFDISWQGHGREASAAELAGMMLRLQRARCHNVNFVTPSHVVPQILEALSIAAEQGLRLPLVYNTGCYDRVETLRLLDGVVDIYMPDFKFWAPEDYREVACRAIREMHRQVGDLVIDDQGLARRGLLVRHLVMPNGSAGTREVMRFLAREISEDTFVNVMPQYRPAGHAHRHESIDRTLWVDEFEEAMAVAREEGIRRFDRG